MTRSSLPRICLAAALLCLTALPACTTVKFTQKNPYTGEIWTVNSHALGSDTISYCAPQDGVTCVDADIVDDAPPNNPPAALPPGYSP